MFDPELHESYDVALLGGGLQNGLLLLFLLERQPGARVALVEAESRLGGCHTWSFHDSDVPKGVEGLLDPLVEHRWPSYRVMFPGLERELVGGYGSFSGESLDRVVQAKAKTAPGVKLCLGCRVERVEAGEVALEDGRRIRAGLIVDSRGPDAYGMAGRPAYQKFLGLEVGLKKPHGMRGPILMDARVGQEEGYRFVYVLPLDDRRLLVEDTYFSDTPDVCRETLRGRVLAYCADEGFEVGEVFKEEVGVLPLPCRDLELKAGTGCLRGGYGGGWFHPTTGYSFPCAVRFADEVSRRVVEKASPEGLRRLEREHRRQFRFGVLLNRLFFEGYRPELRWKVMARFYRLPQSTIERFYALQMKWIDRCRILGGVPPPGFSLRGVLSGVR